MLKKNTKETKIFFTDDLTMNFVKDFELENNLLEDLKDFLDCQSVRYRILPTGQST